MEGQSSKGGIPWWSSAWVGLVGTAVGILIAILGIAYTYWSNQRFRQLTYYVYPIRTVVLRREEATGLRVIFRGQDITTDVTAAQLTIWNQGREPIYRSDILREVRLETVPPVKILEATIRKVSRGETGFAIDVSRLAQGMVPVRWTILEHNDGAILQLIYAGSPLTDISVDGSIVGQRSISTIEFRGKILSPSDQLAALERSKRVTGGLAVFSVSIAIVGSLLLLGLRGYLKKELKKAPEREARFVRTALILMLVSILFGAISNVATVGFQFWPFVPAPPIGLDK